MNSDGCAQTGENGGLAETEGFEPSIRLTAYDDLANRCLQPLGHVSAKLLTHAGKWRPALGCVLCLDLMRHASAVYALVKPVRKL